VRSLENLYGQSARRSLPKNSSLLHAQWTWANKDVEWRRSVYGQAWLDSQAWRQIGAFVLSTATTWKS